MKKKFLVPFLILSGFYAILYFWNKEEKKAEQHPTIHDSAAKPDDYLMEAIDYEDMHRHDKSAYSIEQAIQAIWKLEKDVDDASFDHLEEAIEKLEEVHRKLIRDSIPSTELLKAFEFALGNLAFAELEVAEKYSESNQLKEGRSALRYAQLHIKNALILHSPDIPEDSALLASEVHLLDEMDSLLSQEDMSHEAYTQALDKMLKEVDQIISNIDKD
ncbi:hypothetical protein [Reichenbachiella ulvae]|uniref:Uncharacterized protein n=1 Tax=Reichenbachiella ulvae TaxID=2980104 RepID=A0ABT3CSN2_9BACT|nr:hypothetical protein [Reichenbachiella ulvae]MCV9386573.1 hypothetical protein [Reichenbachiella ulvae]